MLKFKRGMTLLITILLILAFTLTSVLVIPAATVDNDDEDQELESTIIVYYAKPDKPGKPERPDKTKDNYELIGRGVKWKTLPIEYEINTAGTDGFTDLFISAVSASAETWDEDTSTELFDDSYSTLSSASAGTRDYTNVISFGNYPQDGVIGVCYIWGVFGGPPRGREINEFDILLDTDFTWGDATEDSEVMDIQNIVTHEFGHGLGLADLYDDSCSEETMYGYSGYGEIKKRDLNTGDIAGLQELYGE